MVSVEPNSFFEKWKSYIFLIIAFVLLLMIHYLPSPKPFVIGNETVELSVKAKDTLAIFVFAIFAWITGAVPFVITAFISMLLIPAFGILDFSETIGASFGDPLIMFFIGVMLISSAFGASGLSTRLSGILIKKIGGNPKRIIFIFLSISSVCAMWLTEVAAAALMTPVAVEILEKSGCKPLKSNFGKALMISIAWGALIGGMGTPVGSGSNVLAISLLNKYANIDISFLEWMYMGIPAIIILIPIAWLIITRAFPIEISQVQLQNDNTSEKPKYTVKEIATLVIFIFVVVLWVIGPNIKAATGGKINLSTQVVAILGGILLFIPGLNIFDWKTAEKRVDWGGIILIISGLALGKVAFDTGAAKWLAYNIARYSQVDALHPILLSMFAVLAVGIIHLCFSSNTVTGSVTIPIMIALAAAIGTSSWYIAVPASYSACMAFILVTETPTSVIPYSAGYFSLKDMAVIGVPMTLIVSVVVGAVIFAVSSIIAF